MQYEHLNDFANYLKNNSIQYVKRKNGLPNMKFAENRYYYGCFMEELQQKIAYFKGVQRKLQFDHIEVVSKNQENIDNFECVICMDKIDDNVCILKCQHKFCVSCFGRHMRENDNCPLCRDIITTTKPKKIEPMPPQIVSSIVKQQILAKYSERNNMDLSNFIVSVFKKYNDDAVPQMELIRDILMEVQNYGIDVATNCCDWYNQSI